ncbi:hypothetical protein J3F83DRAFT_742183 [Trichoderma novae-zelandiae]
MAATLRGGPVYCEAVLPPEDVYFEGSEDEDYENAAARRTRYEAAGQQFLSGNVPFLLSASLRGPFEEATGWVNPWRSKNRTAHSQPRLESETLGSQCTSPKRPATSVSASTERQAMEAPKNAECALPSPESLKQAPFTAAQSRLQGKAVGLDGWGDGIVSLSSTKDDTDPWVASSPSRRLRKKRSKSSLGVTSASKKRRKTESTETEMNSPPSGRRITASDANQRRANTKADMRNSSIYHHIRELTSKLPRQDISSDDEIVFDDDDSEAFLTTPNKALRRRLNPSSSLSSPPPRSISLGALSPVSISSAQTPTKRAVPPAPSPSRLPSMNGLSPSGTPTRPSRSPVLDMLDVAADRNGDGGDDNTIVPETQSQDQHLPLPKALEANSVNHVNGTSDPALRAPTASYSDCEEHISTSGEATTSQNAPNHSVRGPKTSYEKLHGLNNPMRAAPPRQVTHPVIYDDAEGIVHSSPGPRITALSSSQQPAASPNEAANSPRDSRLIKAHTPSKSSALQSLSSRNGRINSRPALKKAVRSYMSSPLKPPASSADRSYLHTKDSQQTKENVEAKEANESSLPLTKSVKSRTSQPSLDVPASIPEADLLQVDKVQEAHLAPDAAASSAASCPSLPSPEVTPPTEMDDTVQSDELPGVPEAGQPILIQQESATEPQPSIPMEDAGPGMLEMQASRDTSEKPGMSDSTVLVTDGHACAQEQQEQTLGATDTSESLVLPPPQSVEAPRPPSEDMPPPSDEVSKRPSTPEPQFAFTTFSSFMSPSPNHRRQARYSWDGVPNGVGPTSRGILLSGQKGAWRSTTSKKRVSWAPLPHEETGSTGEEILSETDTSSTLSRGRDRAVSPPPPPTPSLASDSLEERDMQFSHHFAAVADRSKGTPLQSVPTASGDASCSPGMESPGAAADMAGSTKVTNTPQTSLQEADKEGAELTGGWDGGEESTDIVEDIFNEMDDFLQIWDVDAELKEARKADKARAAGEKKPDEGMLEVDMGMDVDSDMTLQFSF